MYFLTEIGFYLLRYEPNDFKSNCTIAFAKQFKPQLCVVLKYESTI